jgi:hypothetical protein
VQTFTAALSRLRLRVSRPEMLTTIRDGTASAIKFGLTAYDGAYVDLAHPLYFQDSNFVEHKTGCISLP